jgi:hypothetical protein
VRERGTGVIDTIPTTGKNLSLLYLLLCHVGGYTNHRGFSAQDTVTLTIYNEGLESYNKYIKGTFFVIYIGKSQNKDGVAFVRPCFFLGIFLT